MIETPDPLRTHALARPNTSAMVLAEGCVSYAELNGKVDQVATALRAAGIEEGHRVALRGLAPAEAIVTILALWRLGGVACPVSDRFTENQFEQYGRLIRATTIVNTLPDPLRSSTVGVGRDWKLDVDATVMHSSGSSGALKGVIHTLGAHYYSASGSAQTITIEPDDRWLLALPLYHVGGLAIMVRCLVAGATMAVVADGQTVDEAINTMHPTHLSLVPTQLHRLLRDRSAVPALRHMRAILIGGGPLDTGLAEHAAREKLPVATSYGLTEMASQVCTTSVGAANRWHTAGKVLPYREVNVSDEGEILVRGETLCRRLIMETGSVACESGDWYHTGDIGRFDDAEDLIVLGRRDSMFISGGENIHPEQIESALLQIDGIQLAVVVGVPDDEFGMRPAAFVKAELGDGVDIKRVRHSLEGSDTIERFKLPVAVWPLPDEFLGTMKPNRAALAELARELRTRQI